MGFRDKWVLSFLCGQEKNIVSLVILVVAEAVFCLRKDISPTNEPAPSRVISRLFLVTSTSPL